jgi:hypothetical protein
MTSLADHAAHADHLESRRPVLRGSELRQVLKLEARQRRRAALYVAARARDAADAAELLIALGLLQDGGRT